VAAARVIPAPRWRLILAPHTRLQVATLLALWALWEGLGASGLFYKRVFPSALEIALALVSLAATGTFWFNFAVTAMEVGAALAIGGGLGILVGLLLGGNRFIGTALQPYVNFVASVPKIILLPLLLTAFGVGPASKIAVAAIASFFPLALGTAAGTRHVNPVLIRVGRSFDLSLLRMITMIYLPSLVAPVVASLRIALGVAVVVCLLAEIKFSNMGLGFMVADSYNQSRFVDVYAMLIIIFLITAGGNAVVNLLAPKH
jgi:ABC-type nitrate/sulfonate/bicarbonate transport system permease component